MPSVTPAEKNANDDGLALQRDADGDDDDFSLSFDMDEKADDGAAELDFDLGATGGSGATIAASSEASAELAEFGASGLDFDLDDSSADGNLDDVLAVNEANDSNPVEDTVLGIGLDFDLQADADTGHDAPLALDFDLDATGDDSATTVSAAATTDIRDGSGLDLDLDFGLDNEINSAGGSEDFGLPILDTDVDDAGEPLFDTVQLEPGAAAQALLDPGAGVADGEFGMDTEFRGIFSFDTADEAQGGVGTGTSSVLDFDLGTGLDDADDVGALDVDLEETQFSLRDIPTAQSDDDEGHTLVLGRNTQSGEVDEMQTKLDLAQAYTDMGDTEGARNLLGEVMANGGEEQQQNAREMLSKLS